MIRNTSTRTRAAGLLAAFSLLLTGCFITPGKFTSELAISEDESFSFTYEGEIFFLGLSSLAQMGAASDEFEPSDCYDDDTFETRECTEAELAEQRAEWDAGAEARETKAKEQAAQMAAVTGGIDPTDPEATAELAQLLLRHEGWDRVEDKGNGVFDVSYRVSGKLTHDFLFPVIEDVPTTNPFVQMIIRDDRIVRINAPGFAAQNGDNPMSAMMGGMGGLASLAGMAALGEGKDSDKALADIPELEGTFTILTQGDMEIRANNTDEGASETATGKMLSWEVSQRSTDVPTALIAVRGN
ncbi:hypothetical protein [Erythrobacter rubeus]|uniref:Lipoprotein n=1 Tax=Erythrobacter rubeus TaxID=2760803 RepID=A0ABR8KNI1_9SPHN|nr:hypothetical protein [Erythrobacter rubeus]MBD2842199.1 hypothetical protein [Erythrobacter rubeus]